ncbi:MAG: hypothetical protein NVS1B11_34620 [Terriglobales bacterium]
MNLLELQRQMYEDVRRPLTASFRMRKATQDGRAMSQVASSYIRPNDRLTSFERLEIYNRQYWFRLIGSVSEDFPALAAVLGFKRFDALMLAYLRDNPSTSFTLRDLGARLPFWLCDHPEFVPKTKHSFAHDVARLEWAYVEAFDRSALPPLLLEDFAGLSAQSKLCLQPHLQLLDLRYPVDELVLAVHQSIPPSDILSNAALQRKQMIRHRLPRMRRKAIKLAVHRFDNSVYYRRIDEEAFLLLRALQENQSLEEAIETAFSRSKLSPESQTQKIQAVFAHAAELGWFCSQPMCAVGVE